MPQQHHTLDLESDLDDSSSGDSGFNTHSLIPTGSAALPMTGQFVSSSVTEHFYRGTWGINPRPANISSFKNPFESLLSKLKQNNFIPSLSYGYTAGAHYRLKQALGSLTLGGYDSSRFVPSNLSFDLAPETSRDLVVGIQSITANSPFGPTDSTSLLPSPILSFIDSTVPQIWLPLDACEAFEQAFGLRWDPNTELYLVNDTLHNALLAHNASFTFQIRTVQIDLTSDQTVNITLPYASFDLEVSYPIVESSSSYFPIRRAANQSQYTLGRTFLQEAYLIVDYERSNFSVNPCIFSENAQQNISPIIPVNGSNETGTNTSDGASSPTQHIFLDQSLSGPVVAWITIFAVLGLLILVACFTLIVLAIWRRKPNAKFPAWECGFAPDAEFQAKELGLDELVDIEKSKHQSEGIKDSVFPQELSQNLDQYPATSSTCRAKSAKDISSTTPPSSLATRRLRRRHADTNAKFPAWELGFAPDAEFQAKELGLGELVDIEKSKHQSEGIKDSVFPQELSQNLDQYPATSTTCRAKSAKDINSATPPSSLTYEYGLETANDPNHIVTSPHSPPTDISKSKTVNTHSFDVLEAGHWTLEIWPSIAENIRIRYRDIMGIGNMGSINLLARTSPGSTELNQQKSPDPAAPAVCISCKYPDRVNRSVLQEILGPLKELPIIVGKGSIRRSGYEEDCWCTPEEDCPRCTGEMLGSAFDFGPAAYGRYMQRPDCGASIGVDDIGLESERVSLGGYISLNIGNQWIPTAVTCHHLIDKSNVETLGIQSRADGAGGSPGVKYSIQSSAKIDYDGEIKRLEQRVQNDDQSLLKLEGTNITDAYRSLDKAQLRFGEARRSSGVSIDRVENLQMDWMLIEDIEPLRVGINFVGDTTSFMEGTQLRVGSARQVPTEYMRKDAFTEFMRLRNSSPDRQIGSLSRIHGRGCESGLGDGHLSRAACVLCIGEMDPTTEWSFMARGKLGVSGDSGAWIFTELGTLLGQIFARDDFTGMVYYTPAWALFNNIKRVTGATEIRLLQRTYRDSSDSGYASFLHPAARESYTEECEVESLV